jgi:predicted nucleic acid-binding protein
MKPMIYIETTFISYLTAWPSRDVVIAGHQQVTRDWWNDCRGRYELCVSQLVLQEASAGDVQAAKERLDILAEMTLLPTTENAVKLAESLLSSAALPAKAAADALHVAIAATNGVDYLLTWNCRHLANASMRSRIETVCESSGFNAPIICTPEELLED